MNKIKVYYYNNSGDTVDSPDKADKIEVHVLDSNGIPIQIQYYSTTPKSKNKLLSV